MQILLIEDDKSLATGMQEALKNAGLVVNWVDRGQEALQSLAVQVPDIVILDLGLPDMDGLSLLKTLRRQHKQVQVLILTARDSVVDKVAGLDVGADDYLTKPFDLDELLARLRAFERRLGTASSHLIVHGRITLNLRDRIALVDDAELSLSKREFMLLKALMEQQNRVHTKESLEAKLYSWGEEVVSNTIEVHIHHLRKKLPENSIQTLRGVGYRLTKIDTAG
ncbi:MAG TPA: response regulator [Cellvibrionaceae bacterium]|nr:response regulator [Cellvibrionaceae bacterium]HMY41269.1 response regulator [Marinagarivorans sp.]HNG60605.1 response regulator [Cellvibrionaceae bacterium]